MTMKHNLPMIAVVIAALFVRADETRFDRLDRLFRSADRSYVFVVAHRGLPDAAQGIPENSFAALTNAVAHGADIVEVDPKITADKRYVLMHDANPAGVVFGNYTGGTVGMAPSAAWKGQLENCVLRTSRTADVPSGERICLLEDALEAVRDKAYLWFDVNIYLTSDNLDVMFRIIEQKHMERQCLFSSGLTCGLQRRLPNWIRYFDLAGRRISGTLDQNTPADFNDSSALKDERFGWARRLDEGATMVMTDRPVELVEYLERHGRRKLEIETDTRRLVAPLMPTNVTLNGERVCQLAADTADYRVVADVPSDRPGVRKVTLALKDAGRTRWTDTTDGEKDVWYRAIDPATPQFAKFQNCREFLDRLASSPAKCDAVEGLAGCDLALRLVDDEGEASHALVFTNAGRTAVLEVSKEVEVLRILLVGGGGGAGGSAHPGAWRFRMGGGGAGGEVMEAGPFRLRPGRYEVAVGAGGEGAADPATGVAGGGSSFTGAGVAFRASGGGGGASANGERGGEGGSGVRPGGAAREIGGNLLGGGGAGAGTAGGAGRHGWAGSAILVGGEGRFSDILGDEYAFGGGGAGGTHSINGGGVYGNGATAGGGANSSETYGKDGKCNWSQHGVDGLGGGGAGGWSTPNACQLKGSRGGNGVVVLRVR